MHSSGGRELENYYFISKINVMIFFFFFCSGSDAGQPTGDLRDHRQPHIAEGPGDAQSHDARQHLTFGKNPA